MACYALNVYRGDAWLCIDEGKVFNKAVGMGCPLAGLLYAVGIHGLQKQVPREPQPQPEAVPDDQGPAAPAQPDASAAAHDQAP